VEQYQKHWQLRQQQLLLQQQHNTMQSRLFTRLRHFSFRPRATRNQVALFALTYVCYVAVYLARKPVAVVKPLLQSDLGWSAHQLASIDSAFLLAYTVGQLSLGQLASLFTVPQLLGLAYLCCGASVAAFSLCTTTGEMILAWGLAGFFQAVVNPLLVIWVAEIFPAEVRASVLALWQTSQQLGSIVANGVASAVLHWSDGVWQNLFYVSGATVASFAFPLYHCASSQVEAASSSNGARGKNTAPRLSVCDVLCLPGALSVAVTYLFVKMMRYMCMFWLPLYLVKQQGISTVEAGMLSALFDVGGVAGGIATGLFVDNILGGRMLLACMPLAACAGMFLIALAYAQGSVCIGACMIACGFAISGPDSILGGAASRNLCEYNGEPDATRAVSGTVNGFGSIGALLMGFGTSGLLSRFGWSGLFGIAGVTLIAASGLLISAVNVEKRHFNKRLH